MDVSDLSVTVDMENIDELKELAAKAQKDIDTFNADMRQIQNFNPRFTVI